MAKPWNQVEQSETYKKLSLPDKTNAKIQYWQEVVSAKPEFQQLPQQDKIAARNEFFSKERQLTKPEVSESKARTTYKEYGAPLAHALSTLALGIPRLTARATGAEEAIYPEQETSIGKTLRVATEIPAFALGGIGKIAAKAGTRIVPRLGAKAGQEILRRKALRAGLEGLTAGALSTPRTGYLAPQERLETALTYGAGGAAMPYAGAGISKAIQSGKFIGRTLAKYVGMLGETSMNTINRLGFGKIKQVAQQGGEFLTNVIIPKAKERVVEGITKLGKGSIGFLEGLGFKPDEVNQILKVSKNNLMAFKAMVSGNATEMLDNINRRRALLGKQLGELRNIAEKNKVEVDIQYPLQSLRRELKKYGFIDYLGQAKGKSLSMPGKTIDNLMDIYDEFKGFKTLNMAQFKNFIYQVEAAISNDEKFNVSAYAVRKALNEAENKTMGAITYFRNMNFPELKKNYSDMTTLYSLGDKLDNVINTKSEGFESAFSKLKNYFNSETRKKYLGIYGKDLLDDIDALSAAKDLYPDTVRGGLLRTFGQEAIKGAYNLKEGLSRFSKPMNKLTQPIANVVSGGQPIRQLSLAEALRQVNQERQ